MSAFVYILECNDKSFYTGSTKKYVLERVAEHNLKQGANYTRKRLPVVLVYYEEYSNIGEAFKREKQIQGWSRKKKQALIDNNPHILPELSKNYTEFRKS